MTTSLTTLSDALAGVIETAGPAVVRVAGARRPSTGVVWSADGVILTTEHAVRRDEDITVTLGDGRELAATLVGRDPSTDLALLRVQATGLPVLSWRDADGLKVGQVVLALGRPGRTVRARLGILSAVGQDWQVPGGSRIDRYVEPDIEPAFGISGGPLLDAEGRAIGANTAGLRRGLVLTIPAATLRRVADTLLTHGRVRRGYLGIAAQTVPVPAALGPAVNQRAGLLVHAVEPGSPAERAGLLVGDLVLSIGGRPVLRADELMRVLSEDRIGATESVRFVRAGQPQEVQVIIGDRPAAA
ncbi:MAG TPA: trypsin-like peptidase domain-containing protein [bacterium]|nr:trypsin-like peptidase domain-containing protein [bacterium]